MVSTYKPTKRQRRLGIREIAKLDKYVARRPYPPGVHGPRRQSKQFSEYGLQLAEKQKAKFVYGLREKQLKRLFGLNPKSLIVTLESRLDNIVFRGNFAKSRMQARQMVSHGHFKLNGKKATIASLILKSGDKIQPKKADKIKIGEGETPAWLELDKKTKTLTVKKIPTRGDITSEINEQLIIEYFSR